MDDEQDKTRNIFEDFGRDADVVPLHPDPSPQPQQPQRETSTNITQAEEGITFCLEDGTFTIKYYRHLQEVVCPPPYRMLSLFYMDNVYIVEGRNLHLLLSRIRRNKLGELYALDPAQVRDTDDEAMVVRISRQSYEELSERIDQANSVE